MYFTIILLLVIFTITTSGISIPFIRDVFLQSFTNPSNETMIRQNSSCEECLCENRLLNNTMNFIALNCLANGTCQFFQNFPLSYKLVSSPDSKLYFLQNIYPNASKCCVPNITDLINRLQSVTPITINLTFQPSGFGYDESIPTEAAVIGSHPGVLYWFNPLTTAFLRNDSITDDLTITLYNNETFTALDGISAVNIRDKQTNSYLGNLNYSSLGQVRKLIFINNGQTLVVPTQHNKSLTFFNVNSPLNYTLQQQIPLPLINAHGIAKVNDTLLYISSWGDRSIASCKYENSVWTSQVFVNYTATGDGSHLAVDECERVWFVNTQFGLRIYDSSGVEIANWNMSLSSSNTIYDILLLPNYILLVSYDAGQKILQYNPQLMCP